MSYYVYQLMDYKGFTFYVGITKNLILRIREHEMHKNATPAKIHRVRKTVAHNGTLPYTFEEFGTRKEALKREADLITKFKYQLVNKTHGRVKKESKQRRSKGRSKRCPYCLNFFKQISRHKCKKI